MLILSVGLIQTGILGDDDGGAAVQVAGVQQVAGADDPAVGRDADRAAAGQLQDFLHRLSAHGEQITTEKIDLTNLKSASEIAEKRVILSVLEKTGYNKSKAAELLKVDRKTLYNKLKAYNIDL